MNWLIDAQLPRRLSEQLRALGHDALHTLDLPNGNRTTDGEINRIAAETRRIVISKDRDFLDSHLVTGLPPKLLWVTVGNISNIELLTLFELQMLELQIAFAKFNCIELTAKGLVVHQ
jgi:predicted nuclease of predicted toxin-antitoxin system